MGAFPDVAQGLGFRHEPLNERAPVEDCVAYFDQCVQTYGQCPVYVNPMQCNFGAVIRPVDPAFSQWYHDGTSVTPQIRTHMDAWHAAIPH